MKHFSSLSSVGILALLLLALRLPAAAQAPAWQSARAVATAAATGSYSFVDASAVDAAGNVFLAGTFTNTVVLGSIMLTSVGGPGTTDVFVAKFSPASNRFEWAQRAGGLHDEVPTALVVSGTSVYVAGHFNSPTATFGVTTLANADGNVGTKDVFVAKLTDAGNTGSFVWAQQAGGSGVDEANALAVSGSNVYVAGSFNSPTAGFGAAALVSAGYEDVFVAKLTDAGSTSNFIWAQRAGGTGSDFATAVAVSGSNVYVVGNFYGPSATFGLTTFATLRYFDVFVAKLTDAGSTGSFAWAQQAGGTGSDFATAVAVSGSNVYVAGHFDGSTAAFDLSTLTGAGRSDVFVAKLLDAGSTGSFAWAQRAGGTGTDYATALTASGTNVYVAGYFDSPMADFGATSLSTAGNGDVFVAKLIDAGGASAFAWAQRAGGSGANKIVNALTLSGTSVHVAGYFFGSMVSFGTINFSNPNYPAPLGFLASLTDPTLTATTAGRALAPAQFFPNPARRTATLRLPAGTAPAPLTLTDALGRTVRRYPAPTGPEAALDLQGLPAGLYLLRGAGPAQRLAVE